MAEIVLQHISKTYESRDKDGTGKKAIDDISFTVHDKEFMVIVGPSGCGKSTLLRMIAGLEEISEGTFTIDGKRMNDLSPRDRDIAMVFQNYALYPHMTVYDNMAFGLKLKKVNKNVIKEKVLQTAELLEITDELYRRPTVLSGGQRQRVAIGRAIVRNPKLFLFDEPLSNLDAKLRSQMRIELQKLHRQINATIIYVTHDQTEAMTLGSRIAILNRGHLMQLDSPLQLYNRPTNKFVAGFIGTPTMNFIRGQVVSRNGASSIRVTDECIFELGTQTVARHGDTIEVGVRPEDVLLSEQPTAASLTVTAFENMGNEQLVYLAAGDQTLVARIHSRFDAVIGSSLYIELQKDKLHYFDANTSMRLQ